MFEAPVIPPLDEAAAAAAQARQASLTKPPGSLGRLEELAVRLAAMQGRPVPRLRRKVAVVAAADHGVAAQGVSAYPQDVTLQMVANFVRGGAAVNQLAARAGADVVVVDAGVRAPVLAPGVLARRGGPGTADFTRGPAMPREVAQMLLGQGVALALELGADAVVLGEMGIGNTTAAAALTAALLNLPPAAVTGRGTGVDDAGYARKTAAVARALEVNRPDPTDPVGALAAVGGFEFAFLAGVALGAASARTCVVVDGFPASAAALVACRVAPDAAGYFLASHRSVEPGHRAVLEALGLEPLLDLRLRLGEGTGGLLALLLLDAAVAVHAGMATFEEAGVSRGEPSGEGAA
jgi:nicotinate-nucleotide--dimethylbenzimidazole phosphoribosyltransferase